MTLTQCYELIFTFICRRTKGTNTVLKRNPLRRGIWDRKVGKVSVAHAQSEHVWWCTAGGILIWFLMSWWIGLHQRAMVEPNQIHHNHPTTWKKVKQKAKDPKFPLTIKWYGKRNHYCMVWRPQSCLSAHCGWCAFNAVWLHHCDLRHALEQFAVECEAVGFPE